METRARIAVLTTKAAIKYAPEIEETARVLGELIELVRVVDHVPKKRRWPRRLIVLLYDEQKGICDHCKLMLPAVDLKKPHVDHVVPWAQGGDNGKHNIRLLHAHCNLDKGAICNADDVIRHLEYRLLDLRPRPIVILTKND